jgi:hypothetical protein
MAESIRLDPRDEYARRLEARREASACQERLDLRIAYARFLVLVTALILAWLSLRSAWISTWWLLLPLLLFLPLLIIHDRARRARLRCERAQTFYERGIARLDDRWAGTGETGERFSDKSHPYSEDLDLFGKGSLFELICMARTRAGEETIANWLKQAAEPDEIVSRQACIEELRSRLDLREELAILGSDVRAGVHPGALAAWGQAPPMMQSQSVRLAAAILASITMPALLVWGIWGVGRDIFLIAAAAEVAFSLRLRKQVKQVVNGMEHSMQDLKLLAQVLSRLEREPFAASGLVRLAQAFKDGEWTASRQIAKLDRLRVFLDSSRNMLFAPVAIILLWDIQFTFAIEAWRRKSGPSIARWLQAVGEMEALCSLAGYAYEHPDDPFPEIADDSPCFDGKDLGHPLLPEKTCIRNDIRLCRELRVLIVSGSNMSGKSTLLRTIGVNAILAQAGAPVRAARLRISPMAVGASIQRRDSLQDGTSRFYAEITRLKQLVEMTADPPPLLFLLDELLSGTNSHDRGIGAEAVIADLIRRGAMGLLTTHDLALASIAEVLAPRAENVHFEDTLKNGRLFFDYRLHPGVVRKSNALELMRSIGLDV